MPHGQHSSEAPAWTIRSVAVRTRDGPDRLEQVYRRLLLPDHPSQTAPAGGPPCPAAPANEVAP